MKASLWICQPLVILLGFFITSLESSSRADTFWALQEDGQLLIVDPSNGQLTNVTQLRYPPFAGLSSGEGSLWALQRDGVVWQVNPSTRQQTAVASLRTAPFSGLAYGRGQLWALQENGVIWSVDPTTQQQTAVAWLRWGPFAGLTYGGGALWALQEDGVIWRVDPDTGQQTGVTQLKKTPPFAGLTYSEGWLSALEQSGLVWQFNPTSRTLRALGYLRVPPFVGISFRSFEGQTAEILSTSIVPAFDSDGDGLPDWWESQYFGNPTNAAAGEDNDGDGFSNQEEWIALTCPTNGFDHFRINTCKVVSGGMSLAWQSHTDRVYSVWTSSDLLSWTRHQQGAGTGGMMAYTNSTDAPCVYFRLTVETLPAEQ